MLKGIKKRGRRHIAFIPKRPVRISVRFSEEEIALIKRAAEREGLSMADYVRNAVLSEIFASWEEE